MAFLEVMKSFGSNVDNNIPVVKTNPSRYSGGLVNVHPYISGYWQILIETPKFLSKIYKNKPLVEKWMAFSAESFNPPSRTLTTAVFPGIGGVNKSFVTGQTINNSFSIGFREYTGLPIMKIFNAWTAMFHNQTGVSPISPEDWTESTYKSQAYIIITDGNQFTDNPNGSFIFNKESVQEIYNFYGVYPENNPQEIPQDISGNNSIQLSVNFKFDGYPLTTQDLTQDQQEIILKRFQDTIFGFESTAGDTISRRP